MKPLPKMPDTTTPEELAAIINSTVRGLQPSDIAAIKLNGMIGELNSEIDSRLDRLRDDVFDQLGAHNINLPARLLVASGLIEEITVLRAEREKLKVTK